MSKPTLIKILIALLFALAAALGLLRYAKDPYSPKTLSYAGVSDGNFEDYINRANNIVSKAPIQSTATFLAVGDIMLSRKVAKAMEENENWLLPSAKNIVGCALANHVMLTLQQENPNLKFVVPEEKASIWTFGFYIPRSTAHRREADAALDFMFEANSSQKLADKKRFALTNTKAENLPIAPEQKPSFLKTFDLNQLEIAHDESVMNQLLAGFLKRRLQDQAHP
jgi:spermidine/putrescine-binding protein